MGGVGVGGANGGAELGEGEVVGSSRTTTSFVAGEGAKLGEGLGDGSAGVAL